jgi:hypothetical protein
MPSFPRNLVSSSVLETLGSVYKYDAEARERKLSPQERLLFHLP